MKLLKNCLLILGLSTASLTAENINLLENGGFEQENTAWRSSGSKAGDFALWDTKDSHSGKKSVKLFMPEAMEKTVRWHSAIFPCSGNMKISFWLKMERISAAKNGWLIVRFDALDENRKSIKINNYPGITLFYLGKSQTANQAWKLYSKEIELPDNVKFGRIDFLARACSGVAWLDDVQVFQTEVSDKAENQSRNAIGRAEEEELARLQASQKKMDKSHCLNFLYGLKKGTELEIEDIIIDEASPEKAKGKMPEITVRGTDIYKNGRISFLSWWWLGADSWHDKMLGFDCFSFHIRNREPVIRTKKKKDGKVQVYTASLSQPDIAQMERLASQGLMPFIHLYENKHSSSLKKTAPDRLINSHYWIYCDEDPETRSIRRLAWKAVMRITRNYPSFVYNLHNETYYMDYCIWNIRQFRKEMEKKYGAIKKANSIWKTDYKDFTEVIPPYSPNPLTHSREAMQNFNSHMLWLDWLKFTESKFAETIKGQKAYIKKIDPAARVCVKTPAGSMLRGDRGIYPPSLAAAEDIYCAEISTPFINQYPGNENTEEIKAMLKTVLTWDIVRNAAKNIPLIADESSPSPVDKLAKNQYLASSGDLSLWKFKPASNDLSIDRNTEDIGIKEGWQRKDYDDSEWATMKVPGIWGQNGYKDATIAWYRKNILIPKSKKVYLNGLKLADFANIYVNGNLVKKTNSWKEHFNVDITNDVKFDAPNTIAIRIINKYKQGGFIWGGIRGYVNLTKTPDITRLNANQMRSHFWTALMHGCSGLGMFKYPKNAEKYSIEALRILPYMKKEMETVADIVLPRPRIKGKIGLFYPYDSLRYFLPKDWNEIKNNPIAEDFMNYYAGALFSGIPTDIIRGDETLSEWSKYPVVVLRSANRVSPETLELIKEYVKQGGVLVTDYESLQINDETNEPLKGLERLDIFSGKELESSEKISISGESFNTVKGGVSKKYGAELAPSGKTEILAQYASGKPAITLNNSDKGKIYCIGAQLGMNAFQRLISEICKKQGIKPMMKVSPDKSGNLSCLETHLFEKNGKYVLYLNNWGATAKGAITLPSLSNGEYCVRNVRTGKKIYEGNLRDAPLSLTIESQTPYILLAERSDDANLPIAKLDPEHDAFMKRIWQKSPERKIKVLMHTRGQRFSDKRSNQHVLMPTLPLLLANEGIEIDITYDKIADQVSVWDCSNEKRDAKLEDYQALFIPSPIDMSGKFDKDELETIRKFVANGGGLFVCGLNYYGIHTSSKIASNALKPFDLSILSVALTDDKSNILNNPQFITFKISDPKHPILEFVDNFQSKGSTCVKNKNPQNNAIPLISGKRNGTKAPVLMVMNYGKGRIAAMGESNWMTPEWLKRADNAQLAINIFKWLTGRASSKINKEKIDQVIKTPF